MSLEWQFCSTRIKNTPMSSVDPGNPQAACKENLLDSSSCSSAPAADTFGPPALLDQSISVQNLGYCDINLQNNLSSLNTLGGPKVGMGPAPLGGGISWKLPVSALKDGLILANAPDVLPESLTQFPDDSGFIEQAARFSRFSGDCFSDMLNPFCDIEGLGVCPQGVVRMPVPVQGKIFPMDPVMLLPPQRNGFSTIQASNDPALPSMPDNCECGQIKTEGRSGNIVQTNDEQTKQVVGGSTDSGEPKISGDGAQDGKGFGSNKRKRNRPPAGNVKDINGTQQRIDQSPNTAPGKAAGKSNKQESRASEPPKEEYIHVRARRGQATNSHSLAERVRREKISERMKFLQDLVPGCSKMTGKALMLDEIINYVQSLQRQVEFLSMKLATVNPQLDFNIEGLLANDTLHSRAGHSYTLGFLPDMLVPYPPPLHRLPAGLIQAGLNGMGSPESLRRNLHNKINPASGGGFKDPAQLQNVWGDEFNNVVRIGFNASAPLSSPDNSDGSV